MNPSRLVTLFRAAILTAIFASMMLVLDYQTHGKPTFCGADSGCAEVRASGLGKAITDLLDVYAGGTSLPQLALFALLILLVGSFVLRAGSATGTIGPDGRTYGQPTFIRGRVMALAVMSGIGGVVAAVLVIAQATIHAFCLYCMIVDTSMMFAAACAIVLWWISSDEVRTKRSLASATSVAVIAAWSALATAAIGLPFVWTLYPVAPSQIRELREPGKTTIVSFTDFECPHCRKFHPHLTAAREKPDVAFKRFMVPLPFHEHAMFAARTYMCVPDARKDEVAERLYEMEDMSGDALIALAGDAGVPREEFLECADSDATTAELVRQAKIFQDVGGAGLPLTYVDDYVILGADAKGLETIVASGKSGPLQLPKWGLFALAGLLLVGVTGFSWRRADDPTTDVLSPRGRA